MNFRCRVAAGCTAAVPGAEGAGDRTDTGAPEKREETDENSLDCNRLHAGQRS